ncbi:unnamed protein product [Paramecium primaurelia]|uniref:TLDc domain-containing protein n=1 Tax=Paramecium primaurelia TaxID=5886 RepID=A0A8S1P8I7_PARPR|nr:unnamed protein product [Paramecium primaurelia]
MLKEEAIKKECIKNDHKGFQIVAVDLSDELIKESDQKKYYCVKCLLEKIGNKKIILYEEAIKKVEILNQGLKKSTADKQKETRESIQKLSDVIKSIEGSFKKQFDDLKKQLEIQIDNEQKKLDKIPEPTTPNDDIKLLSSCYQEDGKLASPSPNIDYKEIVESLIQIRKLLKQLENFEQLQDVDKEIQKIEQICQINLEFDEIQKKTPALNLTCDNHKMEIIMFNLNQDQFEQTNPFLCVECTQDLLTRGNKAVSNTISLMKAEEKWNEYIKEQMEKRSQRQSRLNQAIAFIKKLQEKQNSELNKMIQSLNEQLKKQPKEYEELMKLRNTHLKNQDKQNLLEIVKILGQQKNIEFISNQEDSELYQSQKRVLEELIKENLVIENQLQWLQNFDKLPKRSNDSENEKEVVEFLKKSTIQDLYLSFFEMSFNSLSQFKKEENDLQLQGKLLKIQSSDQENQNEALQNQRKWYQQFQQSQAKLEKFKKVDELQSSQLQLEQLSQEEEYNQLKIKKLEQVTENQKKELEKAQIQFKDINQVYEQITEFKQIYKIGNDSFEIGDTELLSQDYAQKLYKYIEQQSNKKIKNKYLIFSSKKSGLNSNTFFNSINKKSNLLMIFKSQTQYIFGGYSPCQWLKCNGYYHPDETSTSFLFSQTLGEFYPINSTNKNYAILMNEQEIGFGYQDMKINYQQQFQKGSSNLGYTYTIPANSTNINSPVKTNLLFGQAEPSIKDIEIIMLTFV